MSSLIFIVITSSPLIVPNIDRMFNRYQTSLPNVMNSNGMPQVLPESQTNGVRAKPSNVLGSVAKNEKHFFLDL